MHVFCAVFHTVHYALSLENVFILKEEQTPNGSHDTKQTRAK